MSDSGGRNALRRALLTAAFLPFSATLPAPAPLASSARAAAPEVAGIRHFSDSGHTRVVIDLSREADYRVNTRTGPHRIVIDIPDGRIGISSHAFPVEDSRVKGVRLNQLRSGAQVVIDLVKRTSFEHFTLYPRDDPPRPYRVVIDVGEAPPERPDGGGADRSRASPRASRDGPVVVVIDPGHGGTDSGAMGPRRLAEKEVNLRVARALYRSLQSERDVRPRLTRSGDQTLSLSRRQELVEELGGDLLISVHVNSSPNRKAHGVEIFYLSLNASRKEASRLRNLTHRGDSAGRRDARASDRDLAFTLGDLRLEEGMMLSGFLAHCVEHELERMRRVKVRKIKQAGFQVLKLNGVPAVLVEIGFFSNREDARLLADPRFAEEMGERLARAVTAFVREHLGARPSTVKTLAWRD